MIEKHKRLLVFQCKYKKRPMSQFECFGHAVKGQSGNPGNVILQIRARLLQGMHNNYIVIIINHSHKQESDHICTVVLCIAAVITNAALSMVVKESIRIVVGKNVRYLFLFALMESYIKCMAS